MNERDYKVTPGTSEGNTYDMTAGNDGIWYSLFLFFFLLCVSEID